MSSSLTCLRWPVTWAWRHVLVLCEIFNPPFMQGGLHGVCGRNSQGTHVCLLRRRTRTCPARGSRLASADAVRHANVMHSRQVGQDLSLLGCVPTVSLSRQLSRQQPPSVCPAHGHGWCSAEGSAAPTCTSSSKLSQYHCLKRRKEMRLRVMHTRRRLSASQRSCHAAHHLQGGATFIAVKNWSQTSR